MHALVFDAVPRSTGSTLRVVGSGIADRMRHLGNAVALDTGDPAEVAWYVADLAGHPEAGEALRRAARAAAADFTWDRVLEQLLGKVAFLAAQQDTAASAP